MKHIFPAIKNKWDLNPLLKRLGGTLFNGDAGQSARPNTSVHGRLAEPMDTFGSDIERWSLEFRLHSRGTGSQDALDWFETMRAAFHRAILASSASAFMSTMLDASDAEDVDDGVYDSRINFICYFQRTSQLPVVGG